MPDVLTSDLSLADTWVLPTPFDVPGMGKLYVNTLVIKGSEPVFIDAGARVGSTAPLH